MDQAHSSLQSPFADLSLERAIALRWALRDIKANRLSLLPVNDDDLIALMELGLVEMHDGLPIVTPAGRAALE
jgi:hypothetical protein